MPTLTIKNIPPELYDRLRQSAALARRSLNSQIIVCLERALRGQRVDPAPFLARVRTLREGMNLPPLTDRFLAKAKTEGRP